MCGRRRRGRWPARPPAGAARERSWCPCRPRGEPGGRVPRPGRRCRGVASKIRSPSWPSITTRAKSQSLADCWAAVSIAPTRRMRRPWCGSRSVSAGSPGSSLVELRLGSDAVPRELVQPGPMGDRGRYLLRPWFETWVGLADEKCRHAESAPTRLNAGSRRRGRRVGISALPVDVPRRVHRGFGRRTRKAQAATASARCTVGPSLRRRTWSGRPVGRRTGRRDQRDGRRP
jgi:hypothetical protein